MDWQKWFTEFPEWIAYFSPEIAIDDSLWSPAGGLGIVSASLLRATYRLHVPVIGVTIRWRQGSYYQKIEPNGMETEWIDHCDDENIVDTGARIRVQIGKNPNVILKVGLVKPGVFGTAPVCCLDADIEENDYPTRQNTQRLYPNDNGQRLAQTIILGIGGIRALRALKIPVKKCHLNEGYSLLSAVELIGQKKATGLSFLEALKQVREQAVFTTHMPGLPGGEMYNRQWMAEMGCFPGLDDSEVAFLGKYPFDPSLFHMTAASLRSAKIANGVSQLHTETSNLIYSWVDGRCPIIPITNGVDAPSWQWPEFEAAQTPEAMREAKIKYRRLLFNEVKEQYAKVQIDKVFKEDVPTFGWNRRFDEYKRPGLIFADLDWFRWFLEQAQIIFAGKPHPNDFGMIKTWNEIWQMSKTLPNLAILPDSQGLKKLLKGGVDVWLNTPRRPREACEDCWISAMLNGALVESSRDGGVIEISLGNYFPFGVENPCQTEAEQDFRDLQDLRQLTPSIIDIFNNQKGEWYRRTLAAKQEAEEEFSAERMVKDYMAQLWSK